MFMNYPNVCSKVETEEMTEIGISLVATMIVAPARITAPNTLAAPPSAAVIAEKRTSPLAPRHSVSKSVECMELNPGIS